jgi:hypothetical protein
MHLDLNAQADHETVLENPHKGWYHHYYDNAERGGLGVDYVPKDPADLLEFPGLRNLFLRIPWSVLHPERDRYDWSLIDRVVEAYVAQGKTISLSITAKETEMVYATPRWLRDLGVPGPFCDPGHFGGQPERWAWRPDYGHPVFLEHLERFHCTLNARYGDQDWLEGISVASVGDWGEGHSSFSGGLPVKLEVLQAHLELHRRAYGERLMYVNDNFVYDGPEPEHRAALLETVLALGYSIRDDSVLVRYWVDRFPNDSLLNPAYFDAVWRDRPTLLEMQHYRMATDPGQDFTWRGPDGSLAGADVLENAIIRSHATWLGYHGIARTFLSENPNLVRRLANRLGYWYFLESVELPDVLEPGALATLHARWRNRGVAPAHHHYDLRIKLESVQQGSMDRLREGIVVNIDGCDNRRWLPNEPHLEHHAIRVPAATPPGEYVLKIGLFEHVPAVALALQDTLRDREGYYKLGVVTVATNRV